MIVLSKNLGSLEEFGKPEMTKSGLQIDNQQETKALDFCQQSR